MAILHLPDAVRASLARWAQATYPHESCGLLIGRCADGNRVVAHVTQAKNIERHVESMIISTLFGLLLAALLACIYVVINFWLAKKLIDQSVLIKKWVQNILRYFRDR